MYERTLTNLRTGLFWPSQICTMSF